MKRQIIFTFFLLLFSLGCSESRKIANIEELRDLHGDNFTPVTILTRDSGLYNLHYYIVEDSQLSGSGTVERGGTTSVFDGEIPYRDMRYVESNDVSTWKTILALSASAVFIGFAASNLSQHSGLKVNPQTHYVAPVGGGGGTSCPLLYSFDGSQYKFETEAAGGAIARLLEYSTIDEMTNARAVNGTYKLLLGQDSYETDHVDELHLLVVDHKPAVRVIADTSNHLHTIGKMIPPMRATHIRMGDCTTALAASDSVYWKSDIKTNPLKTPSELRDEIVLEFPRPVGATSAKFIVSGRNTGLTNYGFEVLLGLAGRNRLKWYDAIDHDSAAAAQLNEFVRREGGLHFEVLERDGWHEQGQFRDPGIRQDKWQLAMLNLANVDSDTLRIRISCTADLWKLDVAGMDFSADEPLDTVELAPSSAITTNGRNVTSLLAKADDNYFVQTRGDSTIVTFDAPPLAPGLERTVFAHATAYFHSWYYNDADEREAFRTAAFTIPGLGPRTSLPEWKKMQMAGN